LLGAVTVTTRQTNTPTRISGTVATSMTDNNPDVIIRNDGHQQHPVDAAGATVIPGIGAATLNRYGAQLLAVVSGESVSR
jgi:hypothetical protein